MHNLKWQMLGLGAVCLLAASVSGVQGVLAAQQPASSGELGPQPAHVPGPPRVLLGRPTYSDSTGTPQLSLVQPEPTDKAMPINLATALRLAGARPLVIAGAQAAVQADAARLQQAQVLWLPTVYLGAAYARFDGATQGQSGSFFINTREELMLGGGATMVFAATDAIFLPLAQRQVVKAREFDVQRARNDALAEVGETYFNIQQARGRLAGAQDALDKAVELQKKITGLAKGLVPTMEVDRVRAATADLQQAAVSAREDWRATSADLTRVLRLDPERAGHAPGTAAPANHADLAEGIRGQLDSHRPHQPPRVGHAASVGSGSAVPNQAGTPASLDSEPGADRRCRAGRAGRLSFRRRIFSPVLMGRAIRPGFATTGVHRSCGS